MGVETGFREGARKYSGPLTRVSVQRVSTVYDVYSFPKKAEYL